MGYFEIFIWYLKKMRKNHENHSTKRKTADILTIFIGDFKKWIKNAIFFVSILNKSDTIGIRYGLHACTRGR